ncbi:hypothetical protein [Nitratidesulfovibrio liaohensis]|jgi:hypothetical protein|uniref:Uncharacterized protein n=1 Tax=Nitratidesulfovibrio liaohensis TaxID=2604158 RepID=A0ABY9R3J9_9BACT|nr:hypothetical protein [Nitratidesulfovibrio liaohensis]WMW66335.1 hypothetical protein KPS_000902 [Nitratidesulfovibrio liaohensis]
MFTPKITAAEAAAISVNVSLKRSIDADTLVGIFKGTHAPGSWMPHLALFFSDVPDAILKKFMAQNELSPNDMLNVFYKLSPAMQHKHFLEVVYGRMEEAV